MHLIDRIHRPLFPGRCNRQPAGAVLIALIIAITLIAALGAAMYTLSASGTYGNLTANLSTRAFYATESGYRYAVSEYNAGGTSRIASLHGAARMLPNGLGAFSISNHAFFFITTIQATAGDNYLSVTTPGEFPSGFVVPDPIRIIIAGETYDAVPDAQTPPGSVTFEITGGLTEDVPVDTMVCLVAGAWQAQTLSAGDSLTISPDVSNAFPEKNGQIEVDGRVYSYKTCEASGTQTILTDIQGLGGAPPPDVADGDDVILRPLLQMFVTGEASGGLLGGSREIAYLFPITDEILGGGVGGGPSGGGGGGNNGGGNNGGGNNGGGNNSGGNNGGGNNGGGGGGGRGGGNG